LWRGGSNGGRNLATALADEASKVSAAIHHASGVYFEARAHATRIEIKKLRYLLEVAEDGESQRSALKLLRRSQESLGQIHDREVLLERLRGIESGADASAAAEPLARMLEAEIRTFYSQYLEARADVLEMCAAVQAWAASMRARRLRQSMLKMGLAVPSAALVVLARVRPGSPRPGFPKRYGA
jgi:hypothetical protein